MTMIANRPLAMDFMGIWQPDMVLPSQYRAPRRTQVPEQRLMAAVLQDAIDCVEKYRGAHGHRQRRAFDEATQWILAQETTWPFSFECICAVLDLDADAVRDRLRVAPERQPIAAREMQIATGEPLCGERTDRWQLDRRSNQDR